MATIDKRGNTYRIRVAYKLPNGKWKQVAETYTPKKKRMQPSLTNRKESAILEKV